jgi:hypothetical protein
MISRKILSACIALFCILAGGCGTGLLERLGDIPDHCELEWGTEGQLQVTLQCR